MFLIDDLVLSPGKAVFFLFQSLAKKAQEELLDDAPLKQELREIYALLETGQITEEEFAFRESQLLEHLERIAQLKSELGAPEGGFANAGSDN
jgi:ParB-like chromosome segregation protein Spo0J